MPGAKKRPVPRLTAGAVKTCKLIRAKQRLISILWDDGEFLVTADHAVLVIKSSTWLVIEACHIHPGDELLLYSAPDVAATKKVAAVKEYQRHQDVVEVTMSHPAATLLVSSSSSTGPYVVVFGKQPNEPWSSDLWMMQLSRMPREMDHALQANDSLQTCQCLSGSAEMKSGAKLFLLPDHVRAVEGLVRHGQLKLKGRDIIFSADYKSEIERAVRELPKKHNVRVHSCKRLVECCDFFQPLSGERLVKRRTFWSSERVPSAVETTVSTTDARSATMHQNPR